MVSAVVDARTFTASEGFYKRAKNKITHCNCEGNMCFGCGECVRVMCVQSVCISVDKQRVADALEERPRTKGCFGVRDGNAPVWHTGASNYPAWRPLLLGPSTPPSKSHNSNSRPSPSGGDGERYQLRKKGQKLPERATRSVFHPEG